MSRQAPTVIYLPDRSICRRDGQFRALDRLVVTPTALYYARLWDDHPRIAGNETWLLPAQAWAVTRFSYRPGAQRHAWDWYIDIDHISVSPDTWTISDRFLDIVVHEGAGYEVLDADELADGIDADEISRTETIAALRALDALTKALQRAGFSVTMLLQTYAPDLPAPSV